MHFCPECGSCNLDSADWFDGNCQVSCKAIECGWKGYQEECQVSNTTPEERVRQRLSHVERRLREVESKLRDTAAAVGGRETELAIEARRKAIEREWG